MANVVRDEVFIGDQEEADAIIKMIELAKDVQGPITGDDTGTSNGSDRLDNAKVLERRPGE